MRKLLILFSIFSFSLTSYSQIDRSQIEEMNSIIQQFEQDGEHVLPKGGKINDIVLNDKAADIQLSIPTTELNKIDEEEFDEMVEHLLPLLPDLGEETEVFFTVANKNGKYVALADYIKEEVITTRIRPSTNRDVDNNVSRSVDPNTPTAMSGTTAAPLPPSRRGALSDKTIWLSAGHGWQYKNDRWRTQRLNKFGLVEDFGSIEAVNYYLLRYLEQAGANVWTVRERDLNQNEVIVDDESLGYSETGAWSKSGSKGYGKNYRYIYSSGAETGRATFTPDIPESGWYWVSTYFREGGNRSRDVRYTVKHAGGESTVSINQEVHGLTWVYLGQFYFEKGRGGNVSISSSSTDVGQAIIADAVRFGGGKSSVQDVEGGLSGKPRFEEAAKYYAEFQGFQKTESDVAVRPKYAEWELKKGTFMERKDAVYVSWHTNAGGGKGTGTESFIYNRGATPGSYTLRNFIHRELIDDIRAEWDPNWKDRGRKAANFGELRNLETMPGALIEIAFHDHEEDAKALKTPHFRNITARAVYQGIVKYYANKAGVKPVFLPEAPTHLSAVNNGKKSIKLTWKEPIFGGAGGDKATAYKVYIGTHGRGFADGVTVRGTSHTFEGLIEGMTYYFKVTATNSGGESFSTPIVAARTLLPNQNKAQALIVDGFDRLDRSGAVKQDDGYVLGVTDRLFIDRMNNYDYAVEHAKGLTYAGLSFDGATNEAVVEKQVRLHDYQVVDWFLGEESTQDKSLDYTERRLISTYLNGGGSLLISGAEHAYELARRRGVDPNFFQNYLKATYAGDDAQTYNFAATPGSFMGSVKGEIDNSTNGYYNVEYPDQLRPTGGAAAILNYSGGDGGAAAIAYKGQDFRVINFGFPLETVYNGAVRNELFSKSLKFLVDLPDKDFEIISDYNEKKSGTDKKYPTDTKTTTSSKVDINSLPNPANVSPNPFNQLITLDIRAVPTGKAKFILRDSKNRKLMSSSWSHRQGRKKTFTMNPKIKPGIYTYKLKVGRKIMYGKILKARN